MLVRHSKHRKFSTESLIWLVTVSVFQVCFLTNYWKTTLGRDPASSKRNLPINQDNLDPTVCCVNIPQHYAYVNVSRPPLIMAPTRASSGCVTVWRRTKWDASPGRWTCSIPHTKPVKQAVFFFPALRRDTALMMLKHVGESLQRPRSQLLHQIFYFWIQHLVLGKLRFFIIIWFLR